MYLGIEKILKKNRSCVEYFLYVVVFVVYVVEKCNYVLELKRYLIIVVFLYDVGYVLFLYSVELLIKKKIGYGYYEVGEQIIDGK